VAVNGYLYVDGVTGPSTSKTGFIDILSFSWGVSQSATYGTGASGKEAKAGRADFSNLSIMKVLDKTSPLLMDFCSRGQVIKKVYILYDKPVGTAGTVQQDYFRVYLQDAIVTSQQLSGSNENPTESLSFAFQAVEVAYKAEKDDGTLDAAVPKGYDLETLGANYAAPDTFT
jgi:type VI secretion system secreted protein Hcp